jgi:hypothetical protein
MIVMNVFRCCECPFKYNSTTGTSYCNHGDDEVEFDLDVDPDHSRQPWCPLDVEPVTVQAGVK